MKKRNIIILACLLLLVAFASPVLSPYLNFGGPNIWSRAQGGLMSDSAFRLPRGYNYNNALVDSAGRMWYDTALQTLWFHDKNMRRQIADSPGAGYMTIGGLITGPGGVDAPLFRSITGALQVDASYWGYDNVGKTTYLVGIGGDTIYSFGGPSEKAAFYRPEFVIDNDTLDASALSSVVHQYFRNTGAVDSFAYTSDINPVITEYPITYRVNVNAKSIGATTVVTLATATSFVVTNVIYTANISGAVSVQPVVSIGSNSSSYNNICTAFTIPTGNGSVTPAGFFPMITVQPVSNGGGASSSIVVNVTTAASVGVPNGYVFHVYVQGFYVH